VEQIQGTQRLVALSAVGKAFPLHCTANGKALLSLVAPEHRASLLMGRLKRYTKATQTDRSALEAEIKDIAKTGLAYDMEEHSVGICAIGAALRDSLGREFSLSIPVPASRFADKRQQLSKLLIKARAELMERC
jgi:DNA-binding IclR family transcriptional regulator